jgi:hypothetical protein
VSAQVEGASGKVMGLSTKNSMKSTASVVSAKWRSNEFGEDEFYLAIRCSGSFVVPVTAKSNHYSLTINWLRCCNVLKKNYVTFFITSPNYTIEDLNIAKWAVNVDLIVDEEDPWNNDYQLSDLHIWRPQGFIVTN